MQANSLRTVLIDGNNVIGAAAGSWWRDPPRAVRGLVERLRCYAAATGERVELVLDVPQPDLSEGDNDGVVVRYATRRGRDAADDRILDILEDGEATLIEVITSDRALAERARSRGALVTGPGRFLAPRRRRLLTNSRQQPVRQRDGCWPHHIASAATLRTATIAAADRVDR